MEQMWFSGFIFFLCLAEVVCFDWRLKRKMGHWFALYASTLIKKVNGRQQ